MSEKLPEVASESVLEIGRHKLRVYVLDDGRRIINAEDLEDFFFNGSVVEGDAGIKELAEFIHGAKP